MRGEHSLFVLHHVSVQATVSVTGSVSVALCDRGLLLLLMGVRLRADAQQTGGQEQEEELTPPPHVTPASPHSAGGHARARTHSYINELFIIDFFFPGFPTT